MNTDNTDWNIKTSFSDFTGNAYISWDGNNSLNNPGNGTISTIIKINTPGTHRFRWRSRIGNGTNSTEHNDIWLRFPDASDFYAEKNGNCIYPKGSGKTPTPNGSGADGWFKVYLSGSTNWTWSTRTSDNDAHNIYVEFDTAGVYTMEISGRSQFHLIDRISLSNGADNPLYLNNDETFCQSGTLNVSSIDEVNPKKQIKLFPNSTNTYLNIRTLNDNKPRVITVYDFKGAELLNVELNSQRRGIDVTNFTAGIYFIKTDKGEKASFIKK